MPRPMLTAPSAAVAIPSPIFVDLSESCDEAFGSAKARPSATPPAPRTNPKIGQTSGARVCLITYTVSATSGGACTTS